MTGEIERKAPRLVIFVSEDWYFWSHRLSLAREALQAGFEVTVVTRLSTYGEVIKKMGFKLEPINMTRQTRNAIAEVVSLWDIIKIFRRLQPDIVHNVAIKPIIYGSIAARIAGVQGLVNTLAGLGWAFGSGSKKARILRLFLSIAFRFLLNKGFITVQNPDDQALLFKIGISPSRIVVIPGSGVELKNFVPSAELDGEMVVLLASRMIWEKGVQEFVKAATILHERGVNARFVLVGAPDPQNPSSIPESQLKKWQTNGHIEWWGHRDNMPMVFHQSNIVCLPSYYREGVPKILIEAASCGRAIVTTDAPGCREIVGHGKNGLLVRPRDPLALADAINYLIENPGMRRRMGKVGRKIVEAEFSMESVIQKNLEIYKTLLKTLRLCGKDK
jgi:glycosyltransferase involved in cell wall biosynthesis